MTINYFTLFGLQEAYTLDGDALQRAYTQLQQRVHPDRMVGKSEAERGEAIQISMDATEGYEALKSPLHRAEHLLALHGLIVNTDADDTHKPGQALLAEMLELREGLQSAASEADCAQQVQDIKTAMKQTETDLADQFAEGSYAAAAQQTIRLRYLGKALEEAMSAQYRLKAV